MPSVHVIGAGPAGSVAAISALKENHTVFLYEEHARAGLPVNCSGLISRKGLDSLSEYTDYKKHIKNRIRGALIDCAGFTLRVDSGKEISYVIDRASFDESLALKAEEEGARVQYGKRVSPPFPQGHIIGADGPNSSVAAHFKFPNISRFVAVSQATVIYDGQMPDCVRVFLSNEKFPGFFAWLIPQDEETAEVAAGCVLPGNPNDALDNLSRHLGISIPDARTHSIIPVAQRKRTALHSSTGNILLAGDAAGQVKSTTGGGVVFGTHCAAIAGKNIGSPREYEKSWRALCGKDLDAHYHIHKMLGTLGGESIRSLGMAASTLKFEEFLQEKGDMDRPTKMLGPALFLHPFRALFGK